MLHIINIERKITNIYNIKAYKRKNKFLLILFFILDMLPFYVIQKTYQVAVVAFCFTIPALITYIFVEKIKKIIFEFLLHMYN